MKLQMPSLPKLAGSIPGHPTFPVRNQRPFEGFIRTQNPHDSREVTSRAKRISRGERGYSAAVRGYLHHFVVFCAPHLTGQWGVQSRRLPASPHATASPLGTPGRPLARGSLGLTPHPVSMYGQWPSTTLPVLGTVSSLFSRTF